MSDAGLATDARAVAELTHADPLAGDSCVLWCVAIAGMLLGARWGATAVPSAWYRMLHGWPGLRAEDLEQLALRTAFSPPGTG